MHPDPGEKFVGGGVSKGGENAPKGNPEILSDALKGIKESGRTYRARRNRPSNHSGNILKGPGKIKRDLTRRVSQWKRTRQQHYVL